jgi:DNA-binding transcriptional MocR family regulator
MTAVARPGEIVLVESPTYPGALEAARLAGLRVVGVPADSGGVLPDALADAFTRTGARLFYCQPRYANPTGSLLSPERRQPVLDAVSRSRAFLLEDDWVRGLEFGGGTPAPTLASQDSGGHVVQVRSLTKPVAPGLRVAAIVSRGAITQRVRALRGASDLFVSPLLQAVALEVLTASSWQRHLSRLCRDLTARRDALVAGLRAALGPDSIPLIPRGGLSLWVKLPDGTNDEAVATKALGLGLALQPGHPFFPAEPAGPYLRLSYAAATPERLTGVGKLLAQAIS